MSADGSYDIESVQLVLAVVETLARSPQPLGVAEVARRLDVPKNRAFRLLQNLLSAGWAEQDGDTGRYRLSGRLVEVAGLTIRQRAETVRQAARHVLELPALAHPELGRLLEETVRNRNQGATGEYTCHLCSAAVWCLKPVPNGCLCTRARGHKGRCAACAVGGGKEQHPIAWGEDTAA